MLSLLSLRPVKEFDCFREITTEIGISSVRRQMRQPIVVVDLVSLVENGNLDILYRLLWSTANRRLSIIGHLSPIG